MTSFRGLLALTFREMWAQKITLGLFLVSTLAWLLLAFAVNLDIVEGSLAGIRLFGVDAETGRTVTDPETGERLREGLTLEGFVLGAQSFVAGAAYWVGLLLGFFATAPLLGSLLERGRIDLLLSKPWSRGRLLAGHVAGVWAAGLALTAYLFGMVWLVLSVKTGVWNGAFLWAIGVVFAMFAVLHSILTLVGVWTQSTALSLIVAYGLLFASIILAFHAVLVPQVAPVWRPVITGLYYVLPDFGAVTTAVVQLAHGEVVADWDPLLSSLAFAGAAYGTAGWLFHRRDF